MHSEEHPAPDQSPDCLEARLCGLPQPAVPAGLEARLLAAIPATVPTAPRRAIGIGALAALAAACLLTVIVWINRDGHRPATATTGRPVTRIPLLPSDDSANSAAWLEGRRDPDLLKSPTFAWPIEEASPLTVATAIPADLLD